MASSSKKVIYAALVGNALIAITKFAAGAITGSSAMLSEGIHSVVDTGNQGLLLHGIRQAKRPPDPQFPFGHGKEVYFWSFVVAILIFAVGAGVSFYEGVLHIMHPEPMQHVVVNYIVLALAAVFEAGAWYFAVSEFSKVKGAWGYLEAVQRGKDPTMFVVLFEDSAAILGLVVALIGVLVSDLTGIPYFDGLASIAIGLILAGTAMWLAYETKGLLIGESANKRVIKGIRDIIVARSQVAHINEILTMHMGPDFILVNVSVDFVDSVRSDELARTVAKLDSQIKQAFPEVKRVFVEAEARRAKATSTTDTPP